MGPTATTNYLRAPYPPATLTMARGHGRAFAVPCVMAEKSRGSSESKKVGKSLKEKRAAKDVKRKAQQDQRAIRDK